MLRSKCWSFVVLGVALLAASAPISRRDAVDYYDPRTLSGSLLNRSGSGGEPLNVIISGKSTPEVLTPAGFLDYARAVGMSEECLGLHHGTKQLANLGDGNGWVEEREVLREHFFLPFFGTCLETIVGGNHLRVFRQDGPKANSGALFLAVSQEMALSSHHMIIPNGYDIGRDRFIQRAVGTKVYYDKTYETTVQNITGMLTSGNRGVNHRIAQDGVIKLLTVTMKK